jgi:hypothetical protein
VQHSAKIDQLMAFRYLHWMVAKARYCTPFFHACVSLRSILIHSLFEFVLNLCSAAQYGYTILGVIVTPKLVWGACATFMSTGFVLSLSTMDGCRVVNRPQTQLYRVCHRRLLYAAYSTHQYCCTM